MVIKNIGLGKILKAYRKENRLSLAKVSKQTKINVATLARIENGCDFRSGTAVKLILWMK